MRNINLSTPPKPYMPHGYYTPLIGLKDEPAGRPAERLQAEAPKAPETQTKEPTQNNSLFSLRTAKTALKYTILAVSALATGVFIYNLAQNPGGLPQNPSSGPEENTFDSPCSSNQMYANPSSTLSLGTPPAPPPEQQALSLQGVREALSKTTTDLTEAVQNPGTALKAAEKVVRHLQIQAIASYYGFNEELEQVPITEHDQQKLDNRAKHPARFKSSFISEALAKGKSAIGKVIALAGALGEVSTPFAQYAAFGKTSDQKYTMGDIETPEKIKGILGEKMTEEEFRAQPIYKTAARNYNASDYLAYCQDYSSKVESYNKIKSQVDPKTFADLEKAHFIEADATSKKVKETYMYPTPNPPQDTCEIGLYRGANKINIISRTEYGDKGVAHDAAKTEFEVREMSDGSILVSRDVRNSESKGKGKSGWDKFRLGCSYYPEQKEVHCTNENFGHIYHALGEVKYQVREQMVSDKCSLITESFISPLLNKQYTTYAINPNKNLPIILSQFVNSERFATKKVKSLWASLTGNVDAVVAFSATLPKDLPKTCAELEELENPTPKIEGQAQRLLG